MHNPDFCGPKKRIMKISALSLLVVLFTILSSPAQISRYPYTNEENEKMYGILNYRDESFNFDALTPIIRTIKLPNGVSLEYAEQGSADGIPVILLHGFPDSRHSYDLVFPLLPASVHAYALSFRGFGESDKPEDGYAPKDFADDVAAFLNTINIKKAVVVGHSMGATVAQQLAISYPDKIAGLVLIGGIYSFNNRADLLEFKQAVKELKDPIDTAFAVEFQQSTLYKKIPPGFFSTIINESMKVPARVWFRALSNLLVSNTKDAIHNFNKPTLILWGEKDVIALKKDQESLKSAIKNSKLIIYEETGHDLQWETPERFTNDLLGFIKQVKF